MDSINDVLLPLGNAVLRIFWLGWAIGVFAAVVNLCARKSDARVRFASNFVFLILLAACLPVCMMTNRTSCLLYTSPSPRDRQKSRMPSSA